MLELLYKVSKYAYHFLYNCNYSIHSAYISVRTCSTSCELLRRREQKNFTLVNLTLESKTSVILENKPEGELSSELGIEEPSTCNCKYFARHNADDITGNDLV